MKMLKIIISLAVASAKMANEIQLQDHIMGGQVNYVKDNAGKKIFLDRDGQSLTLSPINEYDSDGNSCLSFDILPLYKFSHF